MNPSNKLLSDIVTFRTYSKYLSHFNRRETYEEMVNRQMLMHLEKFPKLSKDIIKAFQKMHEYKVAGSMRSAQFAGNAIQKNPIRMFNCSFVSITYPRVFSEILYILLSGTGVGYSVQKHHVDQLPVLKGPVEVNKHVIHDSIAGWAEALQMLMDAFFYGSILPIFDYSAIRAKGTRLSTTGAKAPGAEPLKHMLEEVEKRLHKRKAIGGKLTSLEIHDLICIISDCVLAGGIRRSALISLFSRDDKDMLTCKSGEWWIKHPHRARANNSVVLPRKEVTKDEFYSIFELCQKSGCGEPGFSWTNNIEWGYNPCHEIALHSNQFCNLTSVNQSGVKSKKDFLSRVYSATLLGTLQASYTDFPYLSEKWKTVTEREALLGVSFTGIADFKNGIPASWLKEAAKLAKKVNENYAKKIGINLAARIGCTKPEGSLSCVVGSSSGIHARHSKYYLRRVRMPQNEALAVYLKNLVPELVEDAISEANTVVVTIPQESPDGAILRDEETALELFGRVCSYNTNWIKPSHRAGDNMHNVSATLSVKPEEWDKLKEAMWEHRDKYTGISLLPFSDSNYQQMPFEECNKETFDKYMGYLKEVDLKQVIENEDNTNLLEAVACAGGVCEII